MFSNINNNSRNFASLCKTQSKKEFTATLKQLEKDYRTYPNFKKENAEYIFEKCRELFEEASDPIVQYNALRLAKYTTTTSEFLKDHYKDVWELYAQTIMHEDGNLRNAGVQLLSRYEFGMTILLDPYPFKRRKRNLAKKEIEKGEKFLVDSYLSLELRERQYVHNMKEKILGSDIGDRKGIPFASDTKDKFLKNIRRGMEELRRGRWFEEVLDKHIPKPDKNKILPPIKLKYFQSAEPKERKQIGNMICHQCKKPLCEIGATYDAYADNPIHICESCAIGNYTKDEGFKTREAAEARRRRLFDVGYLLTELLIDDFIGYNELQGIDDVDVEDMNFLMELSRNLYNENFSKREKIELEEMEKQDEIEEIFKELIRKARG